MDFILEQIQCKQSLDKEETRYLPPMMKDNMLVSGLMVGEGMVVHPRTARVGQDNGNKEKGDTVSAEAPEGVEKSEKDNVAVVNSENPVGMQGNEDIEQAIKDLGEIEVENVLEERNKNGDLVEGEDEASVSDEVEDVVLGRRRRIDPDEWGTGRCS